MTPSTVAPVRTVADQVCDRLRSELLAGAHPVGNALREEQLATRFGVSRHPIRKALQKLALEGLLSAKPNCGVVVAPSQLEHVQGLLTPLRVQLELYALERAFSKLDDVHRAGWHDIIRAMERAAGEGDSQGLLDQDAAFHQWLLLVAGLDEMIPVWQAVYGRMRDFHRQGIESHGDLRVVPFVHRRLLESLYGGSLEQARSDWHSHLENSRFNAQAGAAWRRRQGKNPK